MIHIAKWLTVVLRGVDIWKVASYYHHTPTKRTFKFYGLQIGWVMIGVTVAAPSPSERGAKG